jgi:cytidylate kinase
VTLWDAGCAGLPCLSNVYPYDRICRGLRTTLSFSVLGTSTSVCSTTVLISIGPRHDQAPGEKDKTVSREVTRLTSGGVNGEVIILTGPPAAGKTTVAQLLAANASVPTVHLTTDLFYRSIRTGFVLPFLPEAQRQNEVVIDAIVGTVATFARGGYDVVVDGIFGPWFLSPFRAASEHDHLAVSYVVLRPDLDTTLSRAKERVGHELKDVDAITGLHAAFDQLGDLEDHAIDTGDLDAEQTTAEVRRVLASGTYRLM